MSVMINSLVVFGLVAPNIVQGWLVPLTDESVCYGEWGCFSIEPPFTNTGHLPQPPEELGVRFILYTRDTTARRRRQRSRLSLNWSARRMREMVDVSKDMRVIVHGYLDHGNGFWVPHLVRRLLNRADQNVLVLDWGRGAGSINYFQVAANTRLVARMLTAMLRKFMQIGAQPSNFHLIGFSLGAHIVGYTGSQINGIGRITGLDPAGPAFENTTAPVRLDPSDAAFVDVMHTNAVPLGEMGLGYIKPCGTVDFYVNGGRHQPGCYSSILGRLFGFFTGQDVISCDHLRALDYFMDSIRSPCELRAMPCRYPQVLTSPYCGTSLHDIRQCQDCVTMGYDVDLNASGVYYVPTRSQTPFCVL